MRALRQPIALLFAVAACAQLPSITVDAGVDAPDACARLYCSPRVVQLVAGDAHACARTDEGAMYCWGSNESGQLGAHVTELARGAPVLVPKLRVRAIGARGAFTCALVDDGRVLCWGNNTARQVAPVLDSPVREATAQEVPAGVVELGLLAGGGCGRYADGSVACWPWIAPTRTWRYPELTGATALATGDGYWCARRDDASLWCAGDGAAGQLGYAVEAADEPVRVAAAVPTLPPTAMVATGRRTTCALATDATVRCWGDNTFGQTGTGHTEAAETSPALVAGLDGARAVFAAGDTLFAQLADGSVRAWGYNHHGQAGDGALDSRRTPVPALASIATEVVEVVGGSEFACARLRDATVRCWGTNVRGELGRGELGGIALAPVAPRW